MRIQIEGAPVPKTEGAAYIAPGAVLAGDVELGKDTSVWFGAVIRCDGDKTIRIGEGCNIQDNAVLHAGEYPIRMGKGVSVGHNAIVHGATIDDYVLVGMHATVMNGACVGEGSLIAAGALVLENTLIPPHSLVMGVPAKVKGRLSPEQHAYVMENGEEYVQLARRYQRGCQLPDEE